MTPGDETPERRRHRRKQVHITVLLKVGVLLNGRGVAKDISPGGMRLVSSQIFKATTTIQAKDYEGSTMRVMVPTEGLTVNGVIAWVDLKKGEGALKVQSTSDDAKWAALTSTE
ncbi:MAG TPA: PilZ domain-containing protein [Deltaproteobacteria bacterium]|nr:PilZ domain-containing protein [Deltaproteobacteria bacterium]HOM29042.1 PilZ domain-containing protein [Deltaproteobacteria bacterium]HPP80008.1 PilZ domain-containing protein [Deltaproteobacteria bacterium]